jgi:hypothetical protein
MINRLRFAIVRNRYMVRENLHRRLRTLLNNQEVETYVNLALGISDPDGNYSASEHHLGPMIIAQSAPAVVFRLAQALDVCERNEIPNTIYSREIPYLKISVGSEMSMMLRPNEFWVGNIRTYWTHILVANQWNVRIANEAVDLLNRPVERRGQRVERRGQQAERREARLEYNLWRELYLNVENSLLEIARIGNEVAQSQRVELGGNTFMWADAIATSLYERRNEW